MRFAAFQFDLRSRELRRDGAKVVVQDQPLRLLALLLERPGELFTREELHRRLWPTDTFVDFEHGLNAAIKRLRGALGDSAESPQFVETLPRRGYRFVAAIESRDDGAPAATSRLKRLMVLPFRALVSDQTCEVLGFSVPEAVATSLVGLRSLIVRSPTVGSSYATEPLDLGRIARDGEVDAVLTGTIVRASDRLRVSTELIRVPDGAILWADTADVQVQELFGLQDLVVHRIVESLSLELSAREQMSLSADVPSNAEAYEFYLRANRILLLGMRGGDQLVVAREMYEKALALDPRYAPAWARLGRCHWLIGKGSEQPATHLQDADSCFTRALEINPGLILAHSLHAQVEADLGRALPAMVRLLGLAQSAPATPELYTALIQSCRFCGQFEASVAADERARGLDPHISTSANQTYWHLGDLKRAFGARAPGTFGLDAVILARWGRHTEAIDLLREREPTLAPAARTLAIAHRLYFEGKRQECLEMTDRALVAWNDPEGRYNLALNLVAMNEANRALAVLTNCLDDGFIHYRQLKRDPIFDPMRSLPEFVALVERAAAKYQQACIAFADAGGQRLFRL